MASESSITTKDAEYRPVTPTKTSPAHSTPPPFAQRAEGGVKTPQDTMMDFLEIKEDSWSKNEKAHQILKIRNKKAHPFCSYCYGRGCHSFDTVPIHGNKSFKKSKYGNKDKGVYFDALGWASME